MTWSWRGFGVAALALLLARCGPGRAAPARPPRGAEAGVTCQPSVRAWAARCGARRGITVASVRCPAERLALIDLGGEPPLRVELRRGGDGSFRRAGAWGVSPVGDFADWSQVDPSLRTRFDQVVACATEDPALGDRTAMAATPAPAPNAPTTADSVPWLLLGALACALASLWPARRSAAWRRRALLGAAMAAGAFALRALALPTMFFHQNGQGPLWVASTLAPHQHSYGPGYRALFGWIRWLTREPDRGVFLAQGALAALAVPCAAFVARRLGAPRPLAGALALAVAIDPVLGRLARGESYYSVGASLLFVAAALLASAASVRRVRSAGFLLPVVAAALVVAQHALVHPVGWVAAALGPAVLVLGPGPWRPRLRRAALAALILAAVAAVVAGPTMLAVLRSPLAAQWAGGASGVSAASRLRVAGPTMLAVVCLAGGLAWAARSRRRGALAVAVAVAVAVAAVAADVVGGSRVTAVVHQAYARLYAPAVVAVLASLLSQVSRSHRTSRAVAAAVVAVAALSAWRAWPAARRAPTDALEQGAALAWRRGLPAGRVAYLERAGKRIVTLPFYPRGASVGPAPLELQVGGPDEDLLSGGGPQFYVRTSLCSTPEGRAFCERVEGRYRMTLLHEATLPPVPSMTYLPYDVPRVRVALYRVDGRASAAP